MKVLKQFEEAYIKRDPEQVETFMESLFDRNENVIVVGTSGGEWCMGYDEVKELFSSDWEYWGDLRVNTEDAIITPMGDTAFIYTSGTVKYTFYTNNETYTRYLGYVKEFFTEGTEDNEKPDKTKLTEINWKLCHQLGSWEGAERNYLWDVRISFVLVKKETRWIIKQMQFSLPAVGYLPEVRIEATGDAINDFKTETRKMQEYSSNNTRTYEKEILELVQKFNADYMDRTKEPGLIASKYFTSKEPLIINTDKTVSGNQEEIIGLIKNHRKLYDEIILDLENCLVNSNEEVVWIVTNGIMKKNMSEKAAFENTIEKIQEIFTSDVADKDKLFKIRRRIAETLKENARGEEYEWPFRFEGLLIKEDEKWVFKYLQVSFPFYYILEGKTDAVSV